MSTREDILERSRVALGILPTDAKRIRLLEALFDVAMSLGAMMAAEEFGKAIRTMLKPPEDDTEAPGATE